MAEIRCSCFCLLLLAGLLVVAATAQTDLGDVGALTALMRLWGNTVPPSWGKGDPCSSEWEGVGCTGSRVTTLKLSSMGLEGDDIGDIGSLTQLEVLDLSSNPGLTASIPSSIGNLANLTTLILAACNFTGSIPEELGKLEKLTFLALNDNKLTGHIPSSFGSLSNIYWLDFADNMLNGPLPVSNDSTPGLDKLLRAKHFHFSRNQLSGSVPDSLFNPNMVLKHILFDGNKFSGPIPRTVGQLNATLLEVLRLDRNNFYGTVPDDLSNFTHLNELNLSSNQLTGPVPNLTLMNVLYSVDLSNNLFDPSVAPSWFTTIQSLRTLVLQHGKLEGEVPQGLFSLPYLQRVNLKNNLFNGTLDMGGSIPPSLQYVDLENNQISVVSGKWNVTVMLDGNPVCSRDRSRCSQPNYEQAKAPYITSLANCMSTGCPGGEKLNPQSCLCAHPYRGYMQFRAIGFSDLSNATAFRALERTLCDNLGLEYGSVYLENPVLDETGVVQLPTFLFPSTGLEYFNRSEISTMGFALNNHTVKIPSEFGPYFFKAYPYPFPAVGKGRGSGAIIGIAVGCSVLVLALLALAGYAIQQKRRADKAAIETSRPFASWGGTSCKDSGDAPQLKGAQWFSFDEVKKFTNNFSASNEIGSGGYGKVYRGTLPNGQMVAIKRASQGSMQGGVEFKTEIELLSRVHHKNLVSLVGFCFDRGEQILVYEFVPNGTLRDSLSGRSGIRLDWKRRLRVSLGSARGLAYLHELANPPIIHRDVKTANILLDESLVAKVADFGLSKLVADSEKGHVSTQVKGTLGYLDPEYYMTQKLTEKSDVYSFGVVMLELVTGKPPIERGKYVVREVRLAIDKRKKACGLEELLDPAIRGIALSGFDKFVDLAMRCVEESASDRPSMGEVVKEIETILHNEGVNTNPASASSSANDFGTSTGVPLRHPYNDPMPAQGSDEFSHSSVYTVPTRIEPK